MKLLAAVAGFVLLCGLFEGSSGAQIKFVQCARDYTKVGCFREKNTKMDLLVNDRDGKGHELVWKHFDRSLHSLACRCSVAAKAGGYTYFSIRFWGECWGGKSMSALNRVIRGRAHISHDCKNHKFKKCKVTDKEECAGKAMAEYIYLITEKAPVRPLLPTEPTEPTEPTAGDNDKLAEKVCKGTCAMLKRNCGTMLGCGDRKFDVSLHCPATCGAATAATTRPAAATTRPRTRPPGTKAPPTEAPATTAHRSHQPPGTKAPPTEAPALCYNARDNRKGSHSCAVQLTHGASCQKYLGWRDCDSACNLCACSTGTGGSNRQHCGGHGKCQAKCSAKSCSGAKCKCNHGWTGPRCQAREKTAVLTHTTGCGNYKSIRLTRYDSRHTVAECASKCNQESGCEGFNLNAVNGYCHLLRAGCTPDKNTKWTTYKMQE